MAEPEKQNNLALQNHELKKEIILQRHAYKVDLDKADYEHTLAIKRDIQRIDYENRLFKYKEAIVSRNSYNVENYKTQNVLAAGALKTLVFASGGALVAVSGLVIRLASDPNFVINTARVFWEPLLFFSVSFILSVSCSITAFMSQLFFNEPIFDLKRARRRHIAKNIRWATIGSGISSFITFSVGLIWLIVSLFRL